MFTYNTYLLGACICFNFQTRHATTSCSVSGGDFPLMFSYSKLLPNRILDFLKIVTPQPL